MSSKRTEIPESSPSSPPPSVLCGSGVFSRLSSPSMASSGHFVPSQIYDGYRAVEIIDPACTECLAKVGGGPIYSSSEVPISRINTEVVVKRIRRIAYSSTDPDSEGSDELDGEEVPLSNRFQSQVLLSTPRTFQPVLASIPTTIPPSSPSTFHPRHSLNPEVRLSSSQQPRNSPITTSQKLQPVASSSRRRDGLSPLPFPAAQVFQRRDCWPIEITREDPNVASENQEAVARLFRRVDRNSREVIMYANERTIPDTASEEMAEIFSWYKYEFINDFQRTFDDLGRDN
ncbi:hypothetical protein O181_123577 [Austropuccinia psidii MF-1]|uniref:Uncharacterized protein n=1 Tax=Austropuccinia psidii MF-1 TaxID=1389203 RepID=A0A9Q3KQB5_9BASI|nr:hypothetical protein [Austropuccinia psidii MF-1]